MPAAGGCQEPRQLRNNVLGSNAKSQAGLQRHSYVGVFIPYWGYKPEPEVNTKIRRVAVLPAYLTGTANMKSVVVACAVVMSACLVIASAQVQDSEVRDDIASSTGETSGWMPLARSLSSHCQWHASTFMTRRAAMAVPQCQLSTLLAYLPLQMHWHPRSSWVTCARATAIIMQETPTLLPMSRPDSDWLCPLAAS